jgi:hypothetical protein
MMLRYVVLIGLLLFSLGACSSTGPVSQTPEAEEIHKDELVQEEQHNDAEEDEHGHEEEHNGDHEGEDEHEADEEHREHGAHEHGAAELMIAWSGNELAIDLETPAHNVFGFEYAPKTDAEKALVDESVASLESGALLQFNPEANCTLVSGTVETEFSEDAHEHEEDEEHNEEEEETHSDVVVAYNIQCQQPDKLESLDVSQLFAQFPNFESLRAQWVSDTAQSAKDLTPDDSILSFE